MGLLVFFIWRTMKLMPRTKPQQIKPESVLLDRLGRGRRRRRGQGRAGRGRRVPARPRSASARSARRCRRGSCCTARPAPARRCWPRPSPASPARSSSPSRRPRSSRCSPASAPRASGACSPRRASARPAIIFIDEIDAVGGRRGSDNNSEREQTLNQLLVEMDGFNSSGDLVVIAASNLLEKLDPALLRPGRFDRQVFVSPPDVAGREAILKRALAHQAAGADVDLATLARQTSGLTGADLANICNEAAIAAARARRTRDPAGRLRRRARARGRRHAVAPRAQRARAPRGRVARGRPRAVRRAAARRRPRAQDLDRPARPRARLHAQPARGGPLPQDARGADRLHDDAARRARRRGDRLRRGHHRRVRRPAAASPRSRAR